MLFRDLEGKLIMPLHKPNKHPEERPKFFYVKEENGTLRVQE